MNFLFYSFFFLVCSSSGTDRGTFSNRLTDLFVVADRLGLVADSLRRPHLHILGSALLECEEGRGKLLEDSGW